MAREDWMPSTWAAKAAMFANVGAKIAGYATELGLSPADVTAIQGLCELYSSIYIYQTNSQSAATGLTAWRDDAMNTKVIKDLSDPPAFATFTVPAGAKTGILPTFRDWRDQWVSASGYTDAIGEDLMIVATGGDAPEPGDVTPVIQAHAAQSGYLVGIVVTDRGDSDQWIVETRQGPGDWSNAGSYTGKTADVHITPTTPGKPELVDIRVRLRRKNADYGNTSQIATVTVNP
jgi:hypothetical protein